MTLSIRGKFSTTLVKLLKDEFDELTKLQRLFHSLVYKDLSS